MHKVCRHHSCPLLRSPSEVAVGWLLRGHPSTARDTRTSVCPHVTWGQFSMPRLACAVNPLPARKAITKLSVITHGQNCSSSPSSVTPMMSQGMQRLCFFPSPKSLSMMEMGINHRPCPWKEQGAHEATLCLLPLSWKKLVLAGLTLSEELGGRKIACRREGGRVVVSAWSPITFHHFVSWKQDTVKRSCALSDLQMQ